MNQELYQNNLKNLYMLVDIVSNLNIPEMFSAISRCDSIGAILDPTSFIKNNKALEQDKEVILAFLHVWEVAQKFPNEELPE